MSTPLPTHDNVINARAKFIVRIAKNLMTKTGVERQAVLSHFDAKTIAAIRKAEIILKENQRGFR